PRAALGDVVTIDADGATAEVVALDDTGVSVFTASGESKRVRHGAYFVMRPPAAGSLPVVPLAKMDAVQRTEAFRRLSMELGAVHSRVDEASGRFATIDVRGADVLWAKIVRAVPVETKNTIFDYAPIADALAPGEHLVADAKKQ